MAPSPIGEAIGIVRFNPGMCSDTLCMGIVALIVGMVGGSVRLRPSAVVAECVAVGAVVGLFWTGQIPIPEVGARPGDFVFGRDPAVGCGGSAVLAAILALSVLRQSVLLCVLCVGIVACGAFAHLL